MPWGLFILLTLFCLGYFGVPFAVAYAAKARWPGKSWAFIVALLGSWVFWNVFTFTVIAVTQHYYHPVVHH